MSSSVAEKLAKKSSRRPTSAKQVRLKLVYIDFWSTVKLSFLAGICLAIIAIVGTFLVWTVLDRTGIFDQVNSLFKDISGAGGSDLRSILGLGQVMGFSLIVAILDIVVVTALGAVFALLYNLSVKITGGLLVGFTNN
jgi:ABC-type Fe3+ transport system permease subunit